MNGNYDAFFVASSVVVAMLASYTALDLARSITSADGRPRRLWLAGGSIALGFGIWSMHFIGMLAFTLPGMAMSYAVAPLVLSILVAIVASAIALWVATRDRPSLRYFVYGGLAMGAAICGMHYIGMSGLRMAARIEWRPALVAASVAIAIVASFAALWLAFRLRSGSGPAVQRNRVLAAMLMGCAIAGMHYTGMAAAVFVETGEAPALLRSDLLATDGLAVAVTGSTLLILAVGLLSSLVERELARRSAVAEEISRLYSEARVEIAERARVEKALREKDERLSLALEAGGMGTWEWRADTQRLVMSEACLVMHGLPPDFDGEPARIFEQVQPADRERVRHAFRALLSEGVPYEIDYRIALPDGRTRWLRGRGRRFEDADGDHRIIGICADVTAARELEERLRQSQKLEAIGHLAGGIAHDFNNILTAIRGHVELLLDSLAANDPRRADALEIARSAQRAADLTRQLLAFARRQMLHPRPVDLGSLIEDMMPMLRRLLGEDVVLVTSFDAGGTTINADPSQVQQIVMNLAVNARDAMPRGGRIEIEARRRRVDAPIPVVADSVQPGDYVVLHVRDHGSGIPESVRDRIFEPFFTTKPTGKGTGLGLPTVLGNVSQAGGYLAVETEVGVGTTFTIWFPAAAEAAVAAPEPPEQGAADRAAGSASVLVVEDEPSLRALLKRVLRRAGYEVTMAASGEEALARLIGPLDCDLLLTDLVMPGMSGQELAEQARRIRPELRVIYMSGYSEETLVRGGLEDPDLDFLPKPFSPEALTERIAAALAR